MLTKLTLKKLQKLANIYVDPMEDNKQYKLYNQMKSLIRRSASKLEYSAIKNAQIHRASGDNYDMDATRDNLYLNTLDVFDRYNTNPTIKSMCRDTKKSARLRLAFFVGNEIGITRKQNDAYTHGTQDFSLYMGGGYSQADDDAHYIDLIKHGKAMQTPNPADILDDADNIMKNIRLGKKALKHPKHYRKDLKQSHLKDKAVANMCI